MEPITHAIAVLHPTEGSQVRGTVTFIEENAGIAGHFVKITAELEGLTPGKHAIHLHEFGDCGEKDASTAGGHYNPFNKEHGAPNSDERHLGDLGNIKANSNGIAYTEWSDTKISLSGPYSIIGHSLVVHAGEDDFITQPSGNAGARIACGIVGIAQ
jgi:Cu-Zn family superoxide dismutase